VAVPSSFFVHDMPPFDDRVLHILYEALNHEIVPYTKTRRTRFEQARADRGDCVQPGLLPVYDPALLWRHTVFFPNRCAVETRVTQGLSRDTVRGEAAPLFRVT
jgi:hypothetical protein